MSSVATTLGLDPIMSRIPWRQFGRLDLHGSVLGLGTVKWGRNQKLHYAPFQLPTDETLGKLLDAAVELGINVLDTAPAYGVAEERLGQLLARRSEPFIVITKAGEEFDCGESRYDFSSEAVRRSVERSLQRLRRESLDLVLLHCPPDDRAAIENSPALETLAELKAKGWLRYFGVSSMTLEGGLKAVELSDAVMVSWNYRYRDQEEVLLKAGREGKAVLLKKALLSGNLGSSPDTGQWGKEREGLQEREQGGLRRSSPHFGRSVLETCVFSALDMKEVSSLVAGTINPAHLVENAKAAMMWQGAAHQSP